MKTVYLDKSLNTKKIISGSLLTDDIVYSDLVRLDNQTVNVGLEFTKDGDTFLAYADEPKGCAMQDVFGLTIMVYIQTKSGQWVFNRVVNYNLSNNPNGMFIKDSLDANFGHKVTDDDNTNAVTEYEFFMNCLGKGKYPAPFTMCLFDAYLNLLTRMFDES